MQPLKGSEDTRRFHSSCMAGFRSRDSRGLALNTHAGGKLKNENVSAESAVAGLAQNVHDGLEGKPLRDVLASPEEAAELSTGEFGDLLALALGDALLNVALVWSNIDHVLIVGDGHAELRREFLASLLRIVGAIEVVASDGALGAGHVAADDEVRGAIVLPDDHVLDGLTGTGHLHAVRQVCPTEHRKLLLGLLAQSLVGVDAHEAVNVARLSGAASRVHQEDGVLDVALRALQELEVGTVDGVAVLEGDHILALRKRRTHLCRRLHNVLELRAPSSPGHPPRRHSR
mmetsp:Transcript_133440/g.426588  ORF Transcript_133440/g.426588 Transcript_133440/m.426588 type:complete len:288 (-) Transcript_133440:659-1522(-)